MCTVGIPGVLRVSKVAPSPELELWMTKNYHVCARKGTCVLSKSKMFTAIELSFEPQQ